ncbi:DNA-binding protein H-NS [Klebsiella pneumoniae]|nr:DNA-binding protein H-NS [Klebsiella pneumoniae]
MLEVLEKFTIVVAERSEEEKAAEAANRERLEKLSHYREMMIADGINPSELMDAAVNIKVRKNVSLVLRNMLIDDAGEQNGQVRDVLRHQLKLSWMQEKLSKIS